MTLGLGIAGRDAACLGHHLQYCHEGMLKEVLNGRAWSFREAVPFFLLLKAIVRVGARAIFPCLKRRFKRNT